MEKNGFHQPETQFSSDSYNGFHQQKISSDQNTLFQLDRKSVSTSRVKDLLKSKFQLYGKFASTSKNLKIAENIKKLVHWQE